METFSSKSSLARSETTWPEIDVVIATLNCERNLRICLQRIREQKYDGRINVYVIDGGSRDRTVHIAEQYGCKVDVIPGLYSDGVNGAKMIGEKMGQGDFIWHIDSDNFLVGRDVAVKLVEPLIDHAECNISVPMNYEYVGGKQSRMSRYLNDFINQEEIKALKDMCLRGVPYKKNYIIRDMNVGITNASMIRRSAEEAVGFYDNDIELLKRLRKNGLNCGIVVSDAFFEQQAIDGFMKYVFKTVRRVKFFSKLVMGGGISGYFVEPENTGNHFSLNLTLYFNQLRIFIKTRKRSELYFISMLCANILAFLYSFPWAVKLIYRGRTRKKRIQLAYNGYINRKF